MNDLIEEKINDLTTLGLISIEKEFRNESNLELDVVLIKITNEVDGQTGVSHFQLGNRSIELQVVDAHKISQILISGQNRLQIDLLLHGTILIEKNSYVTELRKNIVEFPINNRKYKISVEFSKMIRRYSDGKLLFTKGHFLDSFNEILHSLHHLARLSVIEHGLYPEVTVWQQVKHLEPEIYKLYDEMVTGEESLEKRIELLLIAINFAITSKTKLGASHLIEMMQQRDEPWSVEHLLSDPELKECGSDLLVTIHYLVQKGIVDVVKLETEVEGVFHRLYYIK